MDSFYLRKVVVAAAGALVVLGSVSCSHYSPPSHAPAHGYRWHAHDYYYYPGVHVYYHIYTGYYYYRSSDVWVKVKVLPRHILIGRRDRVKIRVKGKNPHSLHEEHRHRYEPKKYIKTKRRHDRKEREYLHDRHKDYGVRAEQYEHRKERKEKRWKRRHERHDDRNGHNGKRRKHGRGNY